MKDVAAGDSVGYGRSGWRSAHPGRHRCRRLRRRGRPPQRQPRRGHRRRCALPDDRPHQHGPAGARRQRGRRRSAAGDTVVLLGEADGLRVDAAAIAAAIGTISYEVLCAVSARVPRVVVNAQRRREMSRIVRIAVAQYAPHVGDVDGNRAAAVAWAGRAAAAAGRPRWCSPSSPPAATSSSPRPRRRASAEHGGAGRPHRGADARSAPQRACTAWSASTSAPARSATTARWWSAPRATSPPTASCTSSTTRSRGSSPVASCPSSTSPSGGSAW